MIFLQGLSKNFYLFQFNILFTSTSLRSVRVILAWWIMSATNDVKIFAAMIALGGFFDLFSRVIFGFFGDIFNKKKILLFCNFISMLVILVLTFFYFVKLYNILIIAFSLVILGVCAGIREPLHSSMLSSLVPKEELDIALRFKTVISSFVMFSGPILATAILSVFNILYGLIIIFSILLFSFLLILNVSYFESSEKLIKENFFYEWYVNTKDSLYFVFQIKSEFYICILILLTNFVFSSMFTIVMPSLVYNKYNKDVWLLVFAEGAFATGLFLGGSKIIAYLNEKWNRYTVIRLGFYGMGFSLFLMGLGIFFLGKYVYLLALILSFIFLLCGISFSIIATNTMAVRLKATPRKFQNRIVSAVAFMSGLMVPFGNVVCGFLIDHIGLPLTIAGFGVFILIITFYFIKSKSIKEIYSLEDVELTEIYKKKYGSIFSR